MNVLPDSHKKVKLVRAVAELYAPEISATSFPVPSGVPDKHLIVFVLLADPASKMSKTPIVKKLVEAPTSRLPKYIDVLDKFALERNVKPSPAKL